MQNLSGLASFSRPMMTTNPLCLLRIGRISWRTLVRNSGFFSSFRLPSSIRAYIGSAPFSEVVYQGSTPPTGRAKSVSPDVATSNLGYQKPKPGEPEGKGKRHKNLPARADLGGTWRASK